MGLKLPPVADENTDQMLLQLPATASLSATSNDGSSMRDDLFDNKEENNEEDEDGTETAKILVTREATTFCLSVTIVLTLCIEVLGCMELLENDA